MNNSEIALGKHKLTESASAQEWSTRVNHFLVNVNPSLERKYTGETLSNFLLDQIPESLQVDRRRVEDKLIGDGKYPRCPTLTTCTRRS